MPGWRCWPARAVWPLPDHLFGRGAVVLIVVPGHGFHLADLLSGVALVIAVIPWIWLRRSIGRLFPAEVGDRR